MRRNRKGQSLTYAQIMSGPTPRAHPQAKWLLWVDDVANIASMYGLRYGDHMEFFAAAHTAGASPDTAVMALAAEHEREDAERAEYGLDPIH